MGGYSPWVGSRRSYLMARARHPVWLARATTWARIRLTYARGRAMSR